MFESAITAVIGIDTDAETFSFYVDLGDKREAARIGQENYDLIYADDVTPVYAYDKSLHDINYVIACITNYISDGVPAATIYANMEAELQSELDLMFAPPEE